MLAAVSADLQIDVRRLLRLVPLVVALGACGHVLPRAKDRPPPALPEPRRAVRPQALPEWYWQPVESDARRSRAPIDLPADEAAVVRVEGATRVWDELGAEGRARLCRDGLLEVPVGSVSASRRMGAFYTRLREERLPYVLTVDALAFAVHVALSRAFAEVDEQAIVPGLRALLAAQGTRLAEEQRGAGTDTAEALRLARAVVAVGAFLLEGGRVPAPADLVTIVDEEVARIERHEGDAVSPLLGVPIDYARFAVPRPAANAGAHKAMTWLALAPLSLVAGSEAFGAAVDVAAARRHTRAALLLARAVDRDVDAAAHEAWSRLTRLFTLLWGAPDDLSPADLADVAAAIDVPVEDRRRIANVVLVDRVRKRAASVHAASVFDGAGAPGRAGASVRIFGGRAPPDTVALVALTGPEVGPSSGDRPGMHARDGVRVVPSTLDVAAFAGSAEARAALRESGADAFASYDAALARAVAGRPPPDAAVRHASLYGSMLDVVLTWLAPDDAAPRTPAAGRAAVESALAVWTLARRDAAPLGRPLPPRGRAPEQELAVSGAALPAFVEAEPEVIGRLVMVTAQAKRGLAALGALRAGSPSLTLLAEVEDVLRLALRVAAREVNDDALGRDDLTALAALPARLARIESALGEPDDPLARATLLPVTAEVFVDAPGGRVLTSAATSIEPVALLVREPGEGRLVLAFGAHLTHAEAALPRGPSGQATPGADARTFVRGAIAAPFRLVR